MIFFSRPLQTMLIFTARSTPHPTRLVGRLGSFLMDKQMGRIVGLGAQVATRAKASPLSLLEVAIRRDSVTGKMLLPITL